MKREDVSKIFDGATDEQINKILDLNSADIGKAKKDFEKLQTDYNTVKSDLENINNQFEDLKANNATAEDYKTKYENLVADNQRKEDERKKAELEAAERAEFDKYFADNKKEWNNPFIADGYFGKYKEAKTAPENKGKMTADILHELTKDDATAFKGVTPTVQLPGASPIGGTTDRLTELYKDNPFFNQK